MAQAVKPAPAIGPIWWRQEYQDSGKPWTMTTRGPVPSMAQRSLSSPTSTVRNSGMSEGLRAAFDGKHPGARHLDQAERTHQVGELVDLGRGAGDLEDETLAGGVDHPGAKDIGQAQGLDPLGARPAHLDQGQLPLDAVRVAADILDIARLHHV